MTENVLLVEPDFPVPQKSKNHAKFLPLPLLKAARYFEGRGDRVQLVRGNRPLDQLYDNYDPHLPQTGADYYIHPGWTDERVKAFRRSVRKQNICVRFGFQDIRHYKDWLKHHRKTRPLVNGGLFSRALPAGGEDP